MNGDHFLLSDFGPYNIYVCVVITVATIMLLRYFGPYGIIFMTVCLPLQIFPPFLISNLIV
jgi:hypothetical protein